MSHKQEQRRTTLGSKGHTLRNQSWAYLAGAATALAAFGVAIL